MPKPPFANVPLLVTLDHDTLAGRAGRLSAPNLELVLAGIDLVPGRADTDECGEGP